MTTLCTQSVILRTPMTFTPFMLTEFSRLAMCASRRTSYATHDIPYCRSQTVLTLCSRTRLYDTDVLYVLVLRSYSVSHPVVWLITLSHECGHQSNFPIASKRGSVSYRLHHLTSECRKQLFVKNNIFLRLSQTLDRVRPDGLYHQLQALLRNVSNSPGFPQEI
jgi:hypothetical protein